MADKLPFSASIHFESKDEEDNQKLSDIVQLPSEGSSIHLKDENGEG